MDKDNLLIIGKEPPPIGGVTVHVSRLIDHLRDSTITYKFIELESSNLLQIFKSLFSYKVVHLHTSNVWLRFIVSFLLLNSKSKLILTYHGNLGRYNRFFNWIDFLSVRFATIPVVLNKQSFEKAKSLNKNVSLVPAFLPPSQKNALIEASAVSNKIKTLKNNYHRVYCTNAFNVTFDKYGDETYGISSLVKLFSSLNKLGLVVSDPSGNYKKYLAKNKIIISDNIKFFDFNHSFYCVLKNTDGFIRATTTDGDSLSVKEALYLGKTVYCSDCVDRPQGVVLFETQNYDELKKLLSKEDKLITNKHEINIENGFNKLKKIYLELI